MAGREGTSSFRTIAVLTLLPIAGLCVFLAWMIARTYVPETLSPRRARVGSKRKPELPAVPKRAAAGPRIALIIDDVGFDGQHLDVAASIDPNFNFAILPNPPHAAEAAEMLHGRGFEILCHLPMEPRDDRVSPGAHAVLTSMSDAEIAGTTRADIAAVPHAQGVNNHMGSLATSDRRVMRTVLRALPPGMYFIDSVTDGATVAMKVAREMNVRTARRQVFLDDVQTDDAVRRQLAQLAAAAKANGVAVGIGHPHPVTLRVLAREVPRLREEGFTFVRASEVVR
ncbi:MAG TPA: divergent polysaccharide deacetylase family protein [Thermoanaerobaculia bacterium]|nr:divergent polysaccharide deacetylase family protein [Thermoanaerobaculia bacterium]